MDKSYGKNHPPISGVLPFSSHNIGKGDISIFGKGDGSDSNYSDSGGSSDDVCDEPSKLCVWVLKQHIH